MVRYRREMRWSLTPFASLNVFMCFLPSFALERESLTNDFTIIAFKSSTVIIRPMNSPGKVRTARPGHRHRKDNGPQEFQITPAVPPNTRELGTLTHYTQEIIKGGPRAMIAAQHRAAQLSAKYGEEVEAMWCLTTPYLDSLKNESTPDYDMDKRNKAKVRFALRWRPRFLAILALSGGVRLAAR